MMGVIGARRVWRGAEARNRATSRGVGFFVAATALVMMATFAGSVVAAEFTRHVSVDARKLELVNMIGKVTVEGGSGGAFEIEVHVRGADAAEDLVTIEQDEGRVVVVFPIDEHHDYVYPAMGRNSKSTFHFKKGGSSSWWEELLGGGGDKITVRGHGRGLEIWADVTVRVPPDRSTEILHRVGEIEARDVRGDLVLDTASGAVTVRDCKGEILADTGSGLVEAFNISGDFKADTGSGSVLVEDFEGDELFADTGSGRVEVTRAQCRELNVDTGSGGVEAVHISADRAKIDTGSGEIRLQLDAMGDGRFVLDTGSGSAELILPSDASAHVIADTGSGRVRVDVEGATYRHRERDEVEFEIGGGDARVVIDTGSGSIRIRQG